jgi:hypothetical protein
VYKLFEARHSVVIVVTWCDDTVSEAHCARAIGSFKRNQLCGNAHIVAGPVPLALRSSFRMFQAADVRSNSDAYVGGCCPRVRGSP